MRQLSLVALVLATVGNASAQPSAPPPEPPSTEHFVASLRVEGADGCVDEADLAREVERRLERPVFASQGAEAHLTVRVARGEPLRASVLLTRADGAAVGTRELAIPGDCGRLREALALVIALLVDLPAAEVRVPPPPPPVPVPWRPSLLVEGRGELGLGVFPSTAAGVGGALTGALGPLEGGVEGAVWPRAESSLRPGRTAALAAQTVGVFGCGMLRPASWASVGACLHADAGRTSARGQGFADDRSASSLRLDLGAMVRGSIQVAGPVWVSLGVGPVVTPTPLRLATEAVDGERQEPFTGSRVWLRAYAGVGVRFSSKP